MSVKTQANVKLHPEMWDEINSFKNKNTDINSKTEAIEELIKKGLHYENFVKDKIKYNDNLSNFVQLKTLFLLRSLVETRGKELLNSIDDKFMEELEELQELTLKEGADYVGLISEL